MEPSENSMLKLGDVYLKACMGEYKSRTNCSRQEEQKLESLPRAIKEICTSSHIRKLLHLSRYTTQVLDEAVIESASQQEQHQQHDNNQQQQPAESICTKSMSLTQKMIFLCDKYGTDKHLDIMTDSIASRHKELLKEITNDLDLKLQPAITKKEQE